MAVTLRFGNYGSYYGNDYNSSNSLTNDQMKVNATYIYKALSDKGWSKNAIAGILGNMQHESAINPGRWEGNDVGDGPGYGLVQWTPYTKYTEWAKLNGHSDPSTMDANIDRIIYEVKNRVQYYATDDYPESFEEFTKSTKTPYYLACAFAFNYERSWVALYGTEEEKEALRQKRGGSANDWYEYLGGVSPGTSTNRKRKGYKFVLFNKRRRMI